MRNAFAKSLAHGGWNSKFGGVNIFHPCAFNILLETLLCKSIFHGLRVIVNINDDGDIVGDEFVQEGVNGQAYVTDGKYGGLGVRVSCEWKLIDGATGAMSARDFASGCVLGEVSIDFLDEFVTA